MIQKVGSARGFPGGPVVKPSPSSAWGTGSVPGQGAKIPHASWPKKQNIKQKQYCNRLNKDFKIKKIKRGSRQWTPFDPFKGS